MNQFKKARDRPERIAALVALLELERQESKRRAALFREGKNDRALEADGVLLRRARIVDESPALFGRARVTFGEDASRPGHLERFAVRPGSVVHVRDKSEDGAPMSGAKGIVALKRPRALTVVFDEPPSFFDDTVTLARDDDDITIRRLMGALDRVKGAKGRAGNLVDTILGLRSPLPTERGTFVPLDDALNDDQREAIRHALFAPDTALVHGPPGTGKTRAVVEVVRQLVARGERVLCLTSSNAAVDHLAVSLLEADPLLALARSGHPARVHPDLDAHTLAMKTDAHERKKLARTLLDAAFKLLKNARRRSDSGREAWQREREARAEAGKLFADARQLERQAVAEVLRTTTVLCGTLTGFANEVPEDLEFDTLVVDEASQALIPAVLLGAHRAKRVVLAGDHLQLPPTVLSMDAAKAGLSETAFDLLMGDDAADTVSHMLTVQHRMNEELMLFPSTEFYDGMLTAHPSVRDHLLSDLGVALDETVDSGAALLVVDTAGSGFFEENPDGSESRANSGEARTVASLVKHLVDAGLAATDIGVITPYAAQVAMLTNALSDLVDAGLEVDSVDGFQGREKEAIILSTVRSNDRNAIGFVADPRRLNVAITRARRKLIVVGDSATLSVDERWARLFAHATDLGRYRSVFEFPDVMGDFS